MEATQITIKNPNNEIVEPSAQMPNGRSHHAYSTHSVLPPRNKIFPRHASLHKKSQVRHSESTFAKRADKSQVRFKKMDMTAGESNFKVNLSKEHKRQTLRSKVRKSLKGDNEHLFSFYDKVDELQTEFLTACHGSHYSQASEVIVRLLNYTVDYNILEQLLRAIKMLADFYLLSNNVEQAFFYYNQAREGSLLTDHSLLLVEALLGMAECCSRTGIEPEGIKILKKALQYSWIYHLQQLQLRIYDEIGKLHYHMGQLQKAKQYHTRHVNALHEPLYSALRLLSAQRVAKQQQINLEIKYKEISLLLLVHLKIPIKNLQQLPLPYSSSSGDDPVRSHFDINSKYFMGEGVPSAARTLINKNWFFRQQIEDSSLPQHNEAPKHKKYAFIDFQLNKQLSRLNGAVQRQKVHPRNQFPIKQSLQEKIARKIKEPPLDVDWYQKILRQINRDHRNKLLNVRDAVRIRGFNRKTMPNIETVRDLYNGFFECWRRFGGGREKSHGAF